MAIKIGNTKEVSSKRAFMLIAGESGIGKTSLAKTLNEKETLIISAESGLLCLKGSDIDVWELESFDDFKDALGKLHEGVNYKNIYIDSLTEIMELLVSDMKEKYGDDKNGFKLWGEYTDTAIKVIKYLRDLSQYNVYFTCLTKRVQDGLQSYDTFDFSGSKLQDKVKAYFDEVIHYKKVEFDGVPTRVFITDDLESSIAKDRSGSLNKFEKPDLGELTNKVLN